jgi:hypothetical protein
VTGYSDRVNHAFAAPLLDELREVVEALEHYST